MPGHRQTPARTSAPARRPARGAAAGPATRSWQRRYLPPQHGAWAMLLLPFFVGVACTRPVWLHVPLLVAWLGGYLLSYFALLVVKTGRPRRFAAQLGLYTAVTVPAAVLVVALRPAVLVFAPVFAALLGVNVVLARQHAERSLGGGIASAVQACLMVPLAALVAGYRPADVLGATLVLLGYFLGLLLFVKTMIRNRGDRGYLRASIGFHALAALAVGLLAWPLAVPFAWFLARAAWLPRTHLAPKQVGLIELVNSLILLVVVPLVLG